MRNIPHKMMPRWRRQLPILILLFLAFALRSALLLDIPPGLTHDEANHGRDAIGVLNGIWLFYFPLNYGSEPLYGYLVAAAMRLFGENLLALRLVNVFAGLLAVALAYRWARRHLNVTAALAGAGLIAVSFWPLATSRQALRAGLLPMLMIGAVLFFWQLMQGQGRLSRQRILYATLGFAFMVALTLHDYLAARVLWLTFPLFLGYLAVVNRARLKLVGLPTLAGLLLAGLLTVPMFVYLANHPEAETRLEMLDRPLQLLQQGDFLPLLANAGRALLAFVWPGFGDHFLAYNIPGRPVLEPVTALLFVVGVAVCLWRWHRPAYAFLLIWFGVGILPSLITGPEANTTRNLGALPATYLIPAVGLNSLLSLRKVRRPRASRLVAIGLLVLLVGGLAARDYFVRWGQAPDVRAAYQHTLVEMLAFLETGAPGLPAPAPDLPRIISTVYPGAAHDPSVALVLEPELAREGRWVDGRYALVLPEGRPAALLVPTATPLHPYFAARAEWQGYHALRPDDLDPGFTLYRITPGDWGDTGLIGANFDDALMLLDARWLDGPYRPGETAELVTIWRVVDPARVGPIVPPAFTTDVVFFTHVLDGAGGILAQRDALDAPSWDWRSGDLVIQIHQLTIPDDAETGSYPAVVGVYDRLSGARLPVDDPSGAPPQTAADVAPLEVAAP